ncbi:MAG: HEAT repeat domain-containing protein [Spirochaetia bacterium]
MKRFLIPFLLILIAVFHIAAQEGNGQDPGDSIVTTFLNNFERASLEVKIKILKDSETRGPEQMGPLYVEALQYVVSSADRLKTDSLMRELASVSAELAGKSGSKQAANPLWDLFKVNEETLVRMTILRALGDIAEPGEQTVVRLNDWVSKQNAAFRAGADPDFQVLEVAVESLGKIGDASSFVPLLNARLNQYSARISETAMTSIRNLEGNVPALLLDAYQKSTLDRKTQILNLFLGSDELTGQEKAQLAGVALREAVSMAASAVSDSKAIRTLRFTAVKPVTEYKYSEATDAVIRHFNLCVTEYDRGIITKTNMLEAIAALGAMGNEKAAAALASYMDIINVYTENDRQYDTQIVLAVVRNLNSLGHKVAYSSLLYATYLDYSATIKAEVEKAVASLEN